MAGVPLTVVAAQLGHRDTRMTDRHYSHLAPSYVADAVRAGFGTLGIVEDDGVTPMQRKRQDELRRDYGPITESRVPHPVAAPTILRALARRARW